MRVTYFFFRKIFLSRPIFTLMTIILIFISNYLIFSASRSVQSTLEGYAEVEKISKESTFIENLDSESIINPDKLTKDSMNDIYQFINKNYEYAFFTDGLITELTNSHAIEVPAVYINNNYSRINAFPLSEGSPISFDYQLGTQNTIVPILVGFGLAEEYPVGTQVHFYDPALGKNITAEVSGVLEGDISRSNYYALDFKQYYNFSVIIPVNESYLNESEFQFKINGLMNLILLNTDEQKASQLGRYINEKIDTKFNYYNQKDNTDFYNNYFFSSIKTLIGVITFISILILGIAIWISTSTIKIKVRDFTINILLGLSYNKLKKLFYIYYGAISSISLFVVFCLTLYLRYNFWIGKKSYLVTYGFLGLLTMDWIGILSAFIFNILLIIIVTNITMWKIQKIPISIGVIE